MWTFYLGGKRSPGECYQTLNKLINTNIFIKQKTNIYISVTNIYMLVS